MAAGAEAMAAPPTPQELALQRIEFDGRTAEAMARSAALPEAPPTLSHYQPVEWPDGLAPQPAAKAPSGESLPDADVLIVTWTVEEGSALAHVLTPGCESNPPTKSHPAKPGILYWKPYTKNYAAISAEMNPRCPARQKERLGTYWTAKIGGQKITLFKSDSHMSQDGPEDLATTPNRLVWKQIIEDCKPKLVITTGTAGGIGSSAEVGDVVVSRFVTFDSGGSTPQFEPFDCPKDVPTAFLDTGHDLFAANAGSLPKTNTRRPRIVHGKSARSGVVTTKGFQYDDTANTFGLKGKGDACEMGDAVLGYVCRELGADAPDYAMVRNVSDPEIDSADPDAPRLANWIYEHFGRWSSVCSAIMCWAIVAGLDAQD
jgi:nucleoside phosphorylase